MTFAERCVATHNVVMTPSAALASAAAAGIHRIVLPTPFGIGPVNAYLIEDDPLVLVDCGPNVGTTLGVLEEGLAQRGHRLADLGLVVVTHQHLDHVGLAGEITRRTGVPIACLDLLAPYLEDFERCFDQDDDDALELMLRHGVEAGVAQSLRAIATVVRGFGAATPVRRTLEDGGVLTLRDRVFTVLHRPGHSPSDTVLFDEASGIALAGDHLLDEISSNAVITRPLGAGVQYTTRARPLARYRTSLAETRALDIGLVLPGHRDPITDHRCLIDRRLAEQDERAERLHGILASGPQTAHALATAIWPQTAFTQVFLTLSEVLGHLDLLVDDGRVAEEDDGELIRFRCL